MDFPLIREILTTPYLGPIRQKKNILLKLEKKNKRVKEGKRKRKRKDQVNFKHSACIFFNLLLTFEALHILCHHLSFASFTIPRIDKFHRPFFFLVLRVLYYNLAFIFAT